MGSRNVVNDTSRIIYESYINGIFKIIIRFIFRREMYTKFKYLSHNKKKQ